MKLPEFTHHKIIALVFFYSFVLTGQEGVIEEVFVTAEKRSESLQDISQAVTALSDEDIWYIIAYLRNESEKLFENKKP